MNKIYVFICCACYISALAQENIPGWVERAKQAVFTIETYDHNGNVRKGNGFYIQASGEAISDYTLFIGAVRAVVTDADGRTMQVNHIVGADEVYDVIRFKVSVQRSVPFLQVATTMPVQGAETYLLPANEPVRKGKIEEITKMKDSFEYYQIDIPLTSSQVSLPLLTADGEVFALTQADVSGRNKTYGVSVPYIQGIHITSFDLLGKTYTSLGIRKTWSENIEEAQIALLLYASQQDALTYLETLNDFIATFPNLPDGYFGRASHYARFRGELATSDVEKMQMLELAKEDLNMYMKNNPREDESLYNQAKLIYETLLDDSMTESQDWNIRLASEKLLGAIAIEDLPIYRHLEGDIAFFQGDFEKAYNSYMIVNRSPVASSLSFFLAAKTREQLPDVNPNELIALMDSAVVKSMMMPLETVAYLQESIDLKMQFGQYESAVKDYDQLYRVLAGNITDVFYYYREQAKFRAEDFEGALVDIAMAISLNPQNAVYYAEEASVYLRIQDPVKAQESVEKSLALDADFAPSHRLLGICFVRQEKNDEACAAFRKAKELGDTIVDRLIAENCR